MIVLRIVYGGRGIPGNSKRWRATPAMDAFTVDAALAAVKVHELGKRDSIDLLAVSLSATDYVGHHYGSEGAEMCAQQLALGHYRTQSHARLAGCAASTSTSCLQT